LLFIRCWLTHVISSSTKGSDSLGAKPLHGFEVEQVVSCGHGGLSPVRKEGEEGLPGQLTIVQELKQLLPLLHLRLFRRLLGSTKLLWGVRLEHDSTHSITAGHGARTRTTAGGGVAVAAGVTNSPSNDSIAGTCGGEALGWCPAVRLSLPTHRTAGGLSSTVVLIRMGVTKQIWRPGNGAGARIAGTVVHAGRLGSATVVRRGLSTAAG